MVDQQFSVVRPGDLLAVGVELYNLRLSDDGSRLSRIDPAEPAGVVLRLPPQHFREPVSVEDFVEVSAVERHSPLASVPIAAGRRTRLEFAVPDGTLDLPDGLLALLETLTPNPGGTYVDFPAGLSTYPVADRWDLGRAPTGAPRNPLWTARPRVPAGTPVHLSWFSQYPIRDDLGGVLRATDLPLFQHYRAHRLVLTGLGGTIHLSGPDGAATETYEHRAVLGRDVHVRTVTTGRLSTGHPAALVTVVDRRLRRARVLNTASLTETTEQVIGSLVQQTTLIVTEPFLDLTALTGAYPSGGREMPFTTLRITTETAVVEPSRHAGPFLLRSATGPVQFDIVATDRGGHTVSMRAPLAFIPDGTPHADDANGVLADTSASLHPGPVTLAEGGTNGDTDVVLAGAELRVVATGNSTVLPTVARLQVVLDAVAGFTRAAPTVTATLAEDYLNHGLGAEVPFVRLVEPFRLDLGVAASGGLAKPGGLVDVLTPTHGATPSRLVGGAPLTKDALRQALGTPALFGGVDLVALIDEGALDHGPALTRRSLPEGDRFGYTFTAPLTGSTGFVKANGTLTIDSWVVRSTDGRPVAARSAGTVTGITVNVAGFVELVFATITFTSDGGGKTVVDVGTPAMTFLGPLHFLQEMAGELARRGLGGGARVEQDANGVTAGFGVEVPTIAVGVLQLSNLSVESWVRLPFGDEPLSFSLAIASKQRPFIATVAMFGGGGYFALELSTRGIRRLEIGIEFGGSMCLDIVVASGGVTVMAGFYFFIEETDGGSTVGFHGYVRCAGYLSVLGIITVAVEFYLELEYLSRTDATGKTHDVLGGRASLTVSVEVLFFSKSVTLTVEREFVGSAADPPFLECVPEPDWDVYCDAFAEEPA